MAEDCEGQKLTEREREALAALRNSPRVPAGLEKRVVMELQKRGLLSERGMWIKMFALAAAGILLFVLGWEAARWNAAAPKATEQNQFVLFLEKGTELPAMNSAEEKSLASEYANWGRRVSAEGHPATGQRLADAGVKLGSGAEVPWTSTENSLRGYFVISAKGLEEAVELARTCPHLKYGGKIEVRPINTPR